MKKKSGWNGEGHRHSLAKRGVKTISAKGMKNNETFHGYEKEINLKELHYKIKDYAYILGVKPSELSIDIHVWGHWDAAYPTLRLINYVGDKEYNLTEYKTIHTLKELDEFVKELAINMNR